MAEGDNLQRGLTAIAIARNEALNLPGLIENLRGVADRLIVVDDRSTDETAQIAQAAAPFVSYFDHPMEPDGGFAGQRNFGLAQARTDWVIHMDCDERLSPELARFLQTNLPASTLNAYRYQRLNYFLHRPVRHGGWGGWNRPQICRNGAHRVTGRLHEACEIDGGNAMIGQAQGLMHHLNDADFAQRLEKSAQYTALEADRIAANGKPVKARDLALRPVVHMVRKYLVSQGFRDGIPGLIAALHGATAIFRAYALVWDRQNAIARDTLETRLKDALTTGRPDE